jgi:catechol 2,3-dioxygenase-like lactoylglutathione lyase family enzyme
MDSTGTAANGSTREGAARNLVAISPFFIVKDLQASVAFYRDRLGFTLDFQGPDGDVYYAGVKRDGIGIMLKAILPDVLPCPNPRATHGLVGTPTSTRWTPTRFTRSSASAMCRS